MNCEAISDDTKQAWPGCSAAIRAFRARQGSPSFNMEMIVRALLMGIGATLVMDLWAILLRRGFGVSSLDYAMVGRWLGHMPAGRFAHERIAAAPVVPAERVIGWTAH
jgi:hypothetical protein